MSEHSEQRLIVCLGDSLTRGQVSSNYVTRLAARWEPRGCRIVNAGVNGQLVYNVAARLQPVIEMRPDVVTLLAGTNDVNSQFDESWRARYRKKQKLPVDPTHDWFAEQVDHVLSRLTTQTDAHVAVLTIPPLGENLTSHMNDLVGAYNATLMSVAARHGVTVLPLHQQLVALLPETGNPPPYEGDINMIALAAMKHRMLRRSWDRISNDNGLTVLTDHIHLNDFAAAIVADLISEFVQHRLG